MYMYRFASLLVSLFIFLHTPLLSYSQSTWSKQQWSNLFKEFHPIAFAPTQSGGFIKAAFEDTPSPFSISNTYSISKFDSDGDLIWNEFFPNPIGGPVRGLAELPNGQIAVVQGGNGSQTILLSLLSPSGQVIWFQQYTTNSATTCPGNGNFDFNCRVQATSNGNILISNSIGDFIEVDLTGAIVWSTSISTSSSICFFKSTRSNNFLEIGVDSFWVIGTESNLANTPHQQTTAFLISSVGVLQRHVVYNQASLGVGIIELSDGNLLFGAQTYNSAVVNSTDSLLLFKTTPQLQPIWNTKTALSNDVYESVWGFYELSNQRIRLLSSHGSTYNFPTQYTKAFDYTSTGQLHRVIDVGQQISSNDYEPSVIMDYDYQLEISNQAFLIQQPNGDLIGCTPAYETSTARYLSLFFKMDTSDFIASPLSGQVVLDTNTNCLLDIADIPLEGQIITATHTTSGQVFQTVSNQSGYYSIPLPAGTYTLQISGPYSLYWQTCAIPPITITANSTPPLQNIYLQPSVNCPLLEVDISAPFLRMTGGGSTYSVRYCNFGTLPAANSYVTVQLDPFLTITNSSIPIAQQNGNLFTFNLGQVPINFCGDFTLQVIVDTTAIIGQAHCTEAHIYPDSICIPSFWNGPITTVNGTCQNDSVFFKIKNEGSNMIQPLEYYVFEDHVMMRSDLFQLNAGDSITIVQEARPGRTYRLSAQQAAGFPILLGERLATKAIEGCNPLPNGAFNLGFVNQFSNNNSSPFIDIDCQPNIAAYDPNNKQATPVGYQAPHYIDSLTSLDYKIRFQNTGNDTAFLVVIRDTLSIHLDPSTLQMGASSHPYTWQLVNSNILKVTFSDINLVDSLTNEPLSHGFFHYHIEQAVGNPVGTVINNRAAIYFDYNPPIITNTTFHTVGKDFIDLRLVTEKLYSPNLSLKVYPNPFQTATTLEVSGQDFEQLQLQIYDISGRLIEQVTAQGSHQITLHRNNLSTGVYFYQLHGDGQALGTGKLIVQAR